MRHILGKGGRSVRGEEILARALCNTMWKRKFEVLGEELLQVRALDVAGLLDFDDFENLHNSSLGKCRLIKAAITTYVDGPESSSVSSSHVLVESFNRFCPRHLPVFLVHIVGARPRVISNPYTKVLHFLWALLMDLVFRMLALRLEI